MCLKLNRIFYWIETVEFGEHLFKQNLKPFSSKQGNLYGSLHHDSPVAEKIKLPLECANDKFVQIAMNPQGTHILALTDSG